MQIAPLADIVQAYRDAQVAIQALSEEAALHAAQAQSLKAAQKAKKKEEKEKEPGRLRGLLPPPELAGIERDIVQIASEWCVIISLWPPNFSHVPPKWPNVDPYDAETRYPGFGAGAVRIRGVRGRDATVEGLQNAVAAELHDFMGEYAIHITNTWVQDKVRSPDLHHHLRTLVSNHSNAVQEGGQQPQRPHDG